MHEAPYCTICGGPFCGVELLGFAKLGDDEDDLKTYPYNSNLLSSDNIAVG